MFPPFGALQTDDDYGAGWLEETEKFEAEISISAMKILKRILGGGGFREELSYKGRLEIVVTGVKVRRLGLTLAGSSNLGCESWGTSQPRMV